MEGVVCPGIYFTIAVHEDEVDNSYLDEEYSPEHEEKSQVYFFLCAPIEAPQLQDVFYRIHNNKIRLIREIRR
jgi:hypothetical protein